MKDIKTTIVGCVLILIAISALIFVYMGKATLAEAGTFIALIFPFIAAIGFFGAKDSEKK